VLQKPPAEVSIPVRVDQPTIVAPIKHEEAKVYLETRGVELPATEPTVALPNLLERKEQVVRSEPMVITRPRLRLGAGVTPMKVRRHGRGPIPSQSLARVLLIATYDDKPVKAQLEVDGIYRGVSPVDLTLIPGDHLIRIDYAKTKLTQLATSFTAGQSVRLEVELRTPTEAKQRANAPMAGATRE
jgi:hypothetical protein